MAEKAKYLFISGDLVDGVGIYPGQEEDLDITDIYRQYERCAELLSKVPRRINIIACPGNHDAMRLSEPQPKFYTDFSKALYSLPNLTMVSNPGIVNIHSSEEFSGFNVLMYHGYSMNYLVREVESIRSNGGYLRSDLLMRFLLSRRHLAPSHGSALYIADTKKDPLVIEKIPDILLVGDIHYSMVSSYKNVTTICGSCFQSSTAFQEKLGHKPEPSRVAVVNLQTRNVKILKFGE
jgi:DNA polymerase II small subunit